MTPGGNQQDKNKIPAEVGKRAASLGMSVGFSTLFIIFLALAGGLWLDGILHTKPLITLTLVFGSVPVSLYFTYRMARKAVKDFEESRKSESKQNHYTEGDDKGE